MFRFEHCARALSFSSFTVYYNQKNESQRSSQATSASRLSVLCRMVSNNDSHQHVLLAFIRPSPRLDEVFFYRNDVLLRATRMLINTSHDHLILECCFSSDLCAIGF